ncbi:MAG: indolepyruvate oxidoreductase subunit beta [Thermodesulfobacteriota bacterium]
MKPDPLNLIITGVGGQGNVLISQVLGRALMDRGFKVAVGETFGLSQRGGSVQSHIRVSRRLVYGPIIPEGQAHVVLGLEPLETLRVLPLYGRKGISILTNSRPVPPLNVIAGEAVYPPPDQIKAALSELSARLWWLNATAEAQKLGAAIMANIVMLGALAATGLIPAAAPEVERALAEVLPAHRLKRNLTALRRGMKLV